MAEILLYYGTSEGQTERIADHVAEELRAGGHDVTVANADATAADPQDYDGVLLGASVHRGSHQRPVERFARDYSADLDAMPSGFFSVSLSAASEDGSGRADARRVRDEFLETVGWTPDVTTTVAGALKYSEYGWITRFVMKRIARTEGGDTDTSRDYEYTDWDAVDAFADEFSALFEADAT
jgi:menaquinone-dependent protoporphyrinogen oxidase